MQRDFRRLRLLGGIVIFAGGDRAFLWKFDALLIVSNVLNFLVGTIVRYHRGRNIIIIVNIHGLVTLDFLNIISLMYHKIGNN
jgi:hypothetical protein